MKYKIELVPKSNKKETRYTYQIWDSENELVCEMNGTPTTKENAKAEAICFTKTLKDFQSFEIIDPTPAKPQILRFTDKGS
jgi:hypothetical protein